MIEDKKTDVSQENNFSGSDDQFVIKVATAEDTIWAQTICDEMESSAKSRGTGIAKRSP